MNLIVANDDGIEDPGVWMLARELRRLGQVTLYSPDRNYSGYGMSYSGAGMSISLREEFQLHAAEAPPGFDLDIPAYTADAPPATLASISTLHAYAGGADALIAGVNSGWNTGEEAYTVSGTVGAARVGVERGLLGLAVSAKYGDQRSYAGAAAAARRLLGAIRAAFDSLPNVLVNVNVPPGFSSATEVRLTRPSPFTLFSGMQLLCSRAADGVTTVHVERGGYPLDQAAPDEECGALKDGAVSVCVTGRKSAQVLLDAPWPDLAQAFRQ